ncbi:hypothetical protein GUJ93_ZPchr0002g23796 [Zizania palustris]|uniref:RING-type E3 ubiquitin transferase n=1 Tax=Zizania palustris TaxID=103762 RepID=A0A8J5VG10_ZIZPA|nr:hypothetical protein GUJ93_ZPchr0002g23796 [Zizania palustris]
MPLTAVGASGPAPEEGDGGGRGCCTSGMTLELVGAFMAGCLVLYGVILYLNYLYVRWSASDGVHRVGLGVAAGAAGVPARKRAGCGGLDRAVLAAIPVFRFKAAAHDGDAEAAPVECAVCLGAFQDGDALRALPGCRHAFHVGCVDAWLCAHATCPVCRARPVVPLPPPAPAKPGTTKAAEPASRPQADPESQRLTSSLSP